MRSLVALAILSIVVLAYAPNVAALPKIRLVLVNPGTPNVSVKITVTTMEKDELIDIVVVLVNGTPVRTYVYQEAGKPIMEEYRLGSIRGLTKVVVKVHSSKYGWMESAPLYIDSRGETAGPTPQPIKDAAVIFGLLLIIVGIYLYFKRRG